MDVRSIRQPSAFVPLTMSLAAVASVLGHAAVYGTAHEADEGAAAHLFQILIVAQVPVVGFFAIRWLPRAPRQGLRVLGLQAGAALAAFAAAPAVFAAAPAAFAVGAAGLAVAAVAVAAAAAGPAAISMPLGRTQSRHVPSRLPRARRM